MSYNFLEPFESALLGKLKNRTVMAAMTRGFADKDHCATQLMKEYYERRAQDGIALILTEGVIIHPSGDGYNSVPHIANSQQAQSWLPVIEAVHKHNSKIACQLWHCGRISHSDYTGGIPPVSSTNKPAEGMNRQNQKPFGTPIALTKEGISEVHDYYIQAVERALSVGFDAVQLHLGHGYLADQFFDARINDRTDEYGGSVENRCRFAIELTQKVLSKFPHEKIMVRISPSRDMGGIYDWPDMEAMLMHLLNAFWSQGIRTLDISCANADYFKTSGRVVRMARPQWKGILMGGASLTPEQASSEISEGLLDMITWGRFVLANPDFITKLKDNRPLTEFSREMLGQLL